jgi:hypothetical protein
MFSKVSVKEPKKISLQMNRDVLTLIRHRNADIANIFPVMVNFWAGVWIKQLPILT